MKQTMQPISIVVPTLNEEDNLLPLFKRIHTTLSSSSIPYEIIVVDDYSTDNTAAVALHADPKYHVSLLMKQGKPGKAFSLLEGFAAAENELICMIDADLQYPPEAIKLMYHKLQYCEADIVLTERIDNQTGFIRRLTSAVFNLLFIRLLFGIKYDTQSGLKLFRKSILKTVTVEPSPWTFDLEFIIRSLEQNYIIVSQQIPFAERASGVPKVHLLSATIEIGSKSLKLWRTSATKRVKLNYKYSQLMQRGSQWLLACLMITAFTVGVAGSQASAESGKSTESTPRSSLSDALKKAVQNATTPTTNKPAAASTPAATTATAPAATSSTPAATTAATATVQQPTPTAARTTATKAAAVTSAPAATTPLTPATTSPSAQNSQTLTSPTGKTTKYYPTSKLSTSKTQQLLKVALGTLEAGGILIGLGVVATALKAFITRIRRHPVRI